MEAVEDAFEENLDKMDTADLETNRGKSESVAEHHEVPTEDVAVETVGALEN
jgi:hypothetical protein